MFYYACDSDDGQGNSPGCAASPIARRAYEMAVETIRDVFDIQAPQPGDPADDEEKEVDEEAAEKVEAEPAVGTRRRGFSVSVRPGARRERPYSYLTLLM